jgi:putative ABC transport system permease protein
MRILKLVFKNSLRHKLRNILTVLGIAVAVIAFGSIQTVISAWYAGVDASAVNRLITRDAVSFIFPLPLSYRDRIERIPGVSLVTYANWFQGVYIDKNQFFPRLAVDAETFFKAYPEFITDPNEFDTFLKERNSCVIGEKIAATYHLKLGDIMQVEGDIYPGTYQFVVRCIYKPRDKTTDATQMMFHWDYLDQRLKEFAPRRAGNVGWYVVKIADPSTAARVSEAIDADFRNSRAETKTETEAAFQKSFVSMSGAIIAAINFVSIVVIGIILLILGNTMVMTARERVREYAVLKTIGFTRGHLVLLIAGESLLLSAAGGLLGLGLTFPVVRGFASIFPTGWFPVIEVSPATIVLSVSVALLVGVLASIFPIWRTSTTRIVDGLRQVG